MTALDLGDASRVLTPPNAAFSTVAFGDVDFTPASAPHPVTTVGANFAIPRDTGAGANTLTSDATITPAGDWAVFVAFANASATSGHAVVSSGGSQVQLVINPAQILSATFAGESLASALAVTAFGDGVSVVGLAGSTTETLLATLADGVVATGDPAGSASAETWYVPDDTDGADLLGMWMFEATTVDATTLTDTIDAIAALLDVPASPVHGTSGWGITSEGAVTVGSTDFDPPTIPTPPAGGSQAPPDPPEPATPSEMTAAGIYPIRHVWETMPAPTLVDGRPVDWVPTASGNSEYAYLQIVVEGVDITYLNGRATPFPTWRRGEPFGSQSATINLPQLTTFHTIPSWARHGANVSIRLDIIDGDTISLFEGVVMDLGRREDAGVFTLECTGILFTADLTIRTPSFHTPPRDIGQMIPSLLNHVPGRRYGASFSVATGIKTSVAGGWEPLLTGFIQERLATALDKNGRQWTVQCLVRSPVVVKKNTTTIAATVRTGQRGISIDLNSDASQAANVIYGEGIAPNGGRWRNAKYPNWHPDDSPAYPNSSLANYITQGESDSDTDSGRGVSDFERRLGLNDNGYYSAEDVGEVKRFQKRAGITVDGIVGPQTWSAIFDIGANTGTLDGAFIAPIAAAEEVMPRLYGSDGDDLGANPDYDPDIIRVERHVTYGQGVTRGEGVRDAERQLARESEPGWFGVMSFELDPSTMSKYQLREGHNIRILNWHGETVDVHVATARYDEGVVSLEVDSKARDYPTLQALMTRDRDAVDPAKVERRRLLMGEVQTDRVTFDAESPAGRMPEHPVNGGLWDVRRIPLGAFGTVVRTSWYTEDPTTFCLAVFGKEITAGQLLDIVGNPLTATDNPWENDELEDRGLLMAWGWKEQPLGYWPKTYSDPTGATAAPVTGRHVDDMSWDFASNAMPWVWVAMMTADDTRARGRFYVRPGD